MDEGRVSGLPATGYRSPGPAYRLAERRPQNAALLRDRERHVGFGDPDLGLSRER